MKFSLVTVAAAVALVGGASAQSSAGAAPTSIAGISQCIITCSMQGAAAAGCSSFTDASCVCSSAAFQTTAAQCLIANCSTADQASAISLQKTLCGSTTASGASSIIPSSVAAQASSTSIDSSLLSSATAMSSMASGSSSMMMSSSSMASSMASSGTASIGSAVSSAVSSVAASATSSKSAANGRVDLIGSAGLTASAGVLAMMLVGGAALFA